MEADTVPPKYRGINAEHQESVQTHEESQRQYHRSFTRRIEY